MLNEFVKNRCFFSFKVKGPNRVKSVENNFEKNGISSSLLDLSDNKVKIPMYGKIDSLNVSTSTSIILYELIRQRTK